MNLLISLLFFAAVYFLFMLACKIKTSPIATVFRIVCIASVFIASCWCSVELIKAIA